YEHVLIYDNATTHSKHLEGSVMNRSLSAHKIPMGESENFYVEVTEPDGDGNPVNQCDGKMSKVKIQMGHGFFYDQDKQQTVFQPLYYPDGHKKAASFKGMKQILKEQKINTNGKKAQCGKNFNCKPDATDCCIRQILFNQPDLVHVEIILESICNRCGFQIVLLLKFHCELNPIKQCWRYAKRVYRLCPESSKEEDLLRNTLGALEMYLFKFHIRFSTKTYHFMDAYAHGLNGRQAAWAASKYRGHCVLPDGIMAELEKENVV
ncbi:hypothetical protein K435DRAFT_695885, partial [Dendrothele bispora CBS 962.96]